MQVIFKNKAMCILGSISSTTNLSIKLSGLIPMHCTLPLRFKNSSSLSLVLEDLPDDQLWLHFLLYKEDITGSPPLDERSIEDKSARTYNQIISMLPPLVGQRDVTTITD